VAASVGGMLLACFSGGQRRDQRTSVGMGGLGSTAAGCCSCPSIGERSKGKIA
jgi:hypothetical protein